MHKQWHLKEKPINTCPCALNDWTIWFHWLEYEIKKIFKNMSRGFVSPCARQLFFRVQCFEAAVWSAIFMRLLALIWYNRCVGLHDFNLDRFATTWLWMFSSLRTGCREVNSTYRKVNVSDECALCYEEIFTQTGKYFPIFILGYPLIQWNFWVGSWLCCVKKKYSPCSVSFWCMLGVGVEASTKNLSNRFTEG